MGLLTIVCYFIAQNPQKTMCDETVVVTDPGPVVVDRAAKRPARLVLTTRSLLVLPLKPGAREAAVYLWADCYGAGLFCFVLFCFVLFCLFLLFFD